MKTRDLGKERRWIRRELAAIAKQLTLARFKVAARRLNRLHVAILCGKGRAK